MVLKKINALIGLAVIVCLLAHAGVMTYSLITFWYDLALCKGLAHLTVSLVVAHALLSVGLFFFRHDGTDLRHARLNAATVVQRATALLLVVFVHFHMTAYASMATGVPLTPEQSVLTCLGEVVFIASALAHVAVSASRGLVTLGWLPSRAAQRRVERASIAVCAVLGAVALFAVCRFFLGGIL